MRDYKPEIFAIRYCPADRDKGKMKDNLMLYVTSKRSNTFAAICIGDHDSISFETGNILTAAQMIGTVFPNVPIIDNPSEAHILFRELYIEPEEEIEDADIVENDNPFDVGEAKYAKEMYSEEQDDDWLTVHRRAVHEDIF